MEKNYHELIRDHHRDWCEMRLAYTDDTMMVEWFDGVRIDPRTIPAGKHAYQTRHSDYCDNLSLPRTVLEENEVCCVNFCGTIVTDKPLDLKGKGYRAKWTGERPVVYWSQI